MEGRRHVVIEFESYATALACYESPEYKHAASIRDKYSVGDVVVIEGFTGTIVFAKTEQALQEIKDALEVRYRRLHLRVRCQHAPQHRLQRR